MSPGRDLHNPPAPQGPGCPAGFPQAFNPSGLRSAPPKTRQEMKRLEGKNVLVTGGSTGIGRATAIRFADDGANVAINYHTSEREAEITLEETQKTCSLIREKGCGGTSPGKRTSNAYSGRSSRRGGGSISWSTTQASRPRARPTR